jgi:4-hydroxy-tetrahydrodipicolinate synthase
MSFRTDPSRITGSIAPLITPFTDDGALDPESLRRLVEWQIRAGTHGISIGGSTGEPSSQTIDERIQAIEIVAEAIGGRVPFIAGTGSAKLDETLTLTAAAERAGADAALVITPYYTRPTQQALYEWYERVAGDNPNLPIIMYNVPSRTAVELAPETVARLHRNIDNIVGIKETTKDFEHFSRVIEAADDGILVW